MEPLYDMVWWIYVVSFILLIWISFIVYTFQLRKEYLYIKNRYVPLEHRYSTDQKRNQNNLSKIYCDFINFAITNKIPSDDSWKDLSQTILSVYPNFQDRLICCHHLNETEYKVSMLIKLELKPKDIALLLCKSREAISSIRRRLCQRVLKMENASPKVWDEYIKSL